MFVGLDGIPLCAAKTGVGHYTFELARALAHVSPQNEYELLSPFPFATDEDELPGNLRRVEKRVNRFGRRWWTIGLPFHVRQRGFTLFHGTNFNVPLWNQCPTVVTIHDLSTLLYPGTHEAHIVKRARRRLPVMARQATVIITPSESVKREVCEHLAINSNKIVAVPEAARRQFKPAPAAQIAQVKGKFNIEDDFILFVGTIEPRKNIMTLVRAFAEILRTTELRPQLVIAGKEGWLTNELFAFTRQAGFADRLRLTGYVTDAELCALYSSCRVCVYPSIYEGFGLPPLEAMQCGAPVIVSRIPSLRETAGDAARFVAPMNVEELAATLVELLTYAVARAQLSAAGLTRAAEFTWERAAHLTLGVYDEALRRRAAKKN